MNKIFVSTLCGLALCGAFVLGAATAQADVKPQVAEQPVKKKLSRKEQNKLDGVECKRVRETGSRVKKKVCTTAAQRDALARREEYKVNALEDRAILTTPTGE